MNGATSSSCRVLGSARNAANNVTNIPPGRYVLASASTGAGCALLLASAPHALLLGGAMLAISVICFVVDMQSQVGRDAEVYDNAVFFLGCSALNQLLASLDAYRFILRKIEAWGGEIKSSAFATSGSFLMTVLIALGLSGTAGVCLSRLVQASVPTPSRKVFKWSVVAAVGCAALLLSAPHSVLLGHGMFACALSGHWLALKARGSQAPQAGATVQKVWSFSTDQMRNFAIILAKIGLVTAALYAACTCAPIVGVLGKVGAMVVNVTQHPAAFMGCAFLVSIAFGACTAFIEGFEHLQVSAPSKARGP